MDATLNKLPKDSKSLQEMVIDLRETVAEKTSKLKHQKDLIDQLLDMVAKSLPKWNPDPTPRHRKLELSTNCKSNENHCIYYVLNTSRRILVPCPLPNRKKKKKKSGIRTAI